MKVTWGIENIAHVEKTCTTLGSFDGVHLGHRKIIDALKEQARKNSLGRTLLLTFDPHPQQVLKRNGKSIQLLTTIEERLKLLEDLGIDEVGVIRFSESFAKTPYNEFFQHTLVEQIGTKAMVVGFNHAFGKNREGDSEHLKALAAGANVSVTEVEPYLVEGVNISSTRIRTALIEGDVHTANSFLGYEYEIVGTVEHGDHLGRELGYPTANLKVDDAKLLPADGVYGCRVIHSGTSLVGALSIGTRPSVGDDLERKVEVYLLDFSGDLYNSRLIVQPFQFVRSQQKFDSMETLVQQMDQDILAIRAAAAKQPA